MLGLIDLPSQSMVLPRCRMLTMPSSSPNTSSLFRPNPIFQYVEPGMIILDIWNDRRGTYDYFLLNALKLKFNRSRKNGGKQMSISSVSQLSTTQVSSPNTNKNADQTKTTSQTPTATPPQSTTVKDTVTISSAAQAALQQANENLGQEAIETPEQTAQEARSGDRQALQLLSKQAAAQKA